MNTLTLLRTTAPLVVEPPPVLYIHVRCSSDLNDCLNQLWAVTTYARNNGREIVFEMPSYTGDIAKLLDFSKYPVKVHTDASVLPKDAKTAVFNPEVTVKAQVLVHDKSGGGIQSAHVFRFVRLQPTFLEQLKALPVIHSAIHMATSDVAKDVLDVNLAIKDFVTSQRSRPVFMVCDNDEKKTPYLKKYGFYAKTTTDLKNLAETLMDVMILAAAKDLLCIPGSDGKVSGIAVLAKELQTKRIFVLNLIAGKPL